METRVKKISLIFYTAFFLIQFIHDSCQNHEVCAHFNTSIKLLCDSGKLLYVERLTFYNNTNCSGPFHCGRLQTNNFTGVYLACNKTGPCTIPFHLIPIPGDCGKRESVTAIVEYSRINTTKFHDMCQEILDRHGNENELFFSTSDYPRLSPFNSEGLCNCSIRGSNITKVRVLDLKFDKTQEGQTSTFVIEDRGNGTVYNKTSDGITGSSPLLVYNEDVQLPQISTSIIMNLTHGYNNSSSKLLVKVEGTSLAFRCNTPATTSSTITSSTGTRLSTTVKPKTATSAMTTSSTSSSTTKENAIKLSSPIPNKSSPSPVSSSVTTKVKSIPTTINSSTNSPVSTESSSVSNSPVSTESSSSSNSSVPTESSSSSNSPVTTESSSSSNSSVSTELSSFEPNTEPSTPPIPDTILGLSLPVLISAILGGVVLLMVVVIVILCCIRRKKDDNIGKVLNNHDLQELKVGNEVDLTPDYQGDTGGKSSKDESNTTANNFVSRSVHNPGDTSNVLKNTGNLQDGMIIMENTDYVSGDDILDSEKQNDRLHSEDERIVMENVDYVSGDDFTFSKKEKTGPVNPEDEMIIMENIHYVSGDDILDSKKQTDPVNSEDERIVMENADYVSGDDFTYSEVRKNGLRLL